MGTYTTSISVLQMFHCFAYDQHVDYTTMIWNDLVDVVNAKHRASKARSFVSFTRFLQLIIRHCMRQTLEIQHRENLPMCPRSQMPYIMSHTDDPDMAIHPIPLSLLKTIDRAEADVQAYICLHYPNYENTPSPEPQDSDDHDDNTSNSSDDDDAPTAAPSPSSATASSPSPACETQTKNLEDYEWVVRAIQAQLEQSSPQPTAPILAQVIKPPSSIPSLPSSPQPITLNIITSTTTPPHLPIPPTISPPSPIRHPTLPQSPIPPPPTSPTSRSPIPPPSPQPTP